MKKTELRIAAERLHAALNLVAWGTESVKIVDRRFERLLNEIEKRDAMVLPTAGEIAKRVNGYDPKKETGRG